MHGMSVKFVCDFFFEIYMATRCFTFFTQDGPYFLVSRDGATVLSRFAYLLIGVALLCFLGPRFRIKMPPEAQALAEFWGVYQCRGRRCALGKTLGLFKTYSCVVLRNLIVVPTAVVYCLAPLGSCCVHRMYVRRCPPPPICRGFPQVCVWIYMGHFHFFFCVLIMYDVRARV